MTMGSLGSGMPGLDGMAGAPQAAMNSPFGKPAASGGGKPRGKGGGMKKSAITTALTDLAKAGGTMKGPKGPMK